MKTKNYPKESHKSYFFNNIWLAFLGKNDLAKIAASR